jgi:hypothetical protein
LLAFASYSLLAFASADVAEQVAYLWVGYLYQECLPEVQQLRPHFPFQFDLKSDVGKPLSPSPPPQSD